MKENQVNQIIKTFEDAGMKIECGAQYSVRGQIAQLLNGCEVLLGRGEMEENIKIVLTSLDQSFSDELFQKTEAELEDYWHFKWDSSQNATWNTYQFFDLLELYLSFCRRWEEHHNGSCCIVERVRDKYTLPKIKLFLRELTI